MSDLKNANPLWDLLIIGAGISGLSMAQYAGQAGWKTLVLEQTQQPGGCLHSQRFSGALEGFWLELGAHSAFNSYGNLLNLLESVGALHRLQARRKLPFRIYDGGRLQRILTQLSLRELLRAPLRLFSPGTAKIGSSVADYFGYVVGADNYRRVLEPALNAVLCQAAGEFPADSLFNPRRRRKDIQRGFAIAGGLQTVAEIFAAQPGVQVEFGEAAQRIQREPDGFAVHTKDQKIYRTRTLCLATPVTVAAQLMEGVLPIASVRLAEVASASVESIGVALPRSVVDLPALGGIIGRNQAFYSVVSRDVVADARYRGFTFHFRPHVLDEAAQLRCIAQTLNIAEKQIDASSLVRKANELPALRVGHSERVREVDQMLAGTRLALTGNYFTGIAIEDCVTRSSEEWTRLQQEMGALQ